MDSSKTLSPLVDDSQAQNDVEHKPLEDGDSIPIPPRDSTSLESKVDNVSVACESSPACSADEKVSAECDGSYVFVDGADIDTISDDPTDEEDSLAPPHHHSHAEPDVSTQGGEAVVAVGAPETSLNQLSTGPVTDQKEHSQVDQVRDVEDQISVSQHSEDNGVSSSEHQITVEASDSLSNGGKLEEEHNQFDSTGMVQGNPESLTIASEYARVPELHQPADEEKVEEHAELEATKEGEENEPGPSIITEVPVSESHLIDNDGSIEGSSTAEVADRIDENQGQVAVIETLEPEPHQLTGGEETTEHVDEIHVQEPSVTDANGIHLEETSIAVSLDSKLTHLDNGEAKVEDKNNLASAEEGEIVQESQTAIQGANEHEFHQLDNEEEKIGEQSILTRSDEQVEEEPQIGGPKDIASETDQVDNGGNESEEVVSEGHSEIIQGSQTANMGATEHEFQQLDNEEEKIEEQTILTHSAEQAEEEPQIVGSKDVSFETDQVVHEENESENIVNGDFVEERAGNLPPVQEQISETAVCHVDGSQIVNESTNVTDESVSICPVEPTISEIEVVNQMDEGGRHTSPCSIGDTELKSVHANGSVESSETLSPRADESQSQIDVEYIHLEDGDSMPTPPSVSTDLESKVEDASVQCESFPACSADEKVSETEDTKPSPERDLNFVTAVHDDTNAVNEALNDSDERDESMPTHPLDDTNSVIEVENGSVEGGENTPTCSVGDEKSEAGISGDFIESDPRTLTVPAGVAETEFDIKTTCMDRNSSSLTCLTNDRELESDAGSHSATRDRSICIDDNAKLESVVPNGSNGFAISFGSVPKCVNGVIDVDIEGDLSITGDSDVKPVFDEVEGVERSGSRPSSPEDLTTDTPEEQKVNQEVVRRPFRYLIRIPRYVDDKCREEIRLAQLQVEEKTQTRDAIRAGIQSKRATCSDYRDRYEAARSEERVARDALNAKRQELDSVQSVINKMKNATSIDEIDGRVHNMEHMIEHETMPLKEEKQLIREIKQLRNLREQLSSSLGKQPEEQLTLDQRDKIEERFKLLKRELDTTRREVLRTEGITKAARNLYFGENDKLKELHAQFRAADNLRQEAYIRLQDLKKQFYEKNKHFRMYKEDLTKAGELASSGDKEELQRLCVGQVEEVMELWNKNDEFRKEYIRCNTMSTLRRLRTSDGRSLGPDEEPPVIHSFLNDRVNDTVSKSLMMDSAQGKLLEPVLHEKAAVKSHVNLEQKSHERDVQSVVHLEKPSSIAEVKSVVKLEEKNPAVGSKKPTKPTALKTSSVTVSREVESEEERKQILEEELAKKAEDLRKEEATAKLKEQRRLEEKAKAKEAEERKKRNAEKAQARAELRAQKEAELKEKERERRARKKERKIAAAASSEVTSEGIEGEAAPVSEVIIPESTQEIDIKEKPTTVTKRSQKPLVKQTKVKAIPPPLRKGKRRMQPWMWAVLAVLVIVALFMVGNGSFPSKFGMPSFGF